MATTQIRTQNIEDGAVTGPKLGIPTTKGDILGYNTGPIPVIELLVIFFLKLILVYLLIKNFNLQLLLE